jgi:hypothetical protein
VVVEPGALARYDLGVDLRRTGVALRVVTEVAPGRVGAGSGLAGRVLDASTGSPIGGVRVALAGIEGERVTTVDGRFSFGDVDPGDHTLEVEHLGYGRQTVGVEVAAASDVAVELRLAPQALELGEVRVRSRRETLPVYIAGARSMRTVTGERLETLATGGAPVYQALIGIPGLRIGYAPTTQGGSAEACVEATRARIMSRGCYQVEVVLDGVPVDPAFGRKLLVGPATDFERIEFLGPGEAMRWGMRANEAGAVFLWTKGRAPR